jgi:Mg2+/Co2+ transporter CorC
VGIDDLNEMFDTEIAVEDVDSVGASSSPSLAACPASATRWLWTASG